MLDYFREGSWALQRVRLDYLGGAYDGRGLLIWNPTDGFHLDAFLERSGLPLPSVIEWGKPRVLEPWELRRVWMQMDPGVRAISARIVASDHAELIGEPRLEADFSSALVASRLPMTARCGKPGGRALYEVGRGLLLPDSVVTESRLENDLIHRTFSRAGLRYQDDLECVLKPLSPTGGEGRVRGFSDALLLDIEAHLDSDRYLRVEWLLSGTLDHRRHAWRFGDAFALALSIVSGRTIHLLEHTHVGRATEFCERRRRRDLTDLDLLKPLPGRDVVEKDVLICLVKAFLTNLTCEDISRRIFEQLAEAARQQTHSGRELLCGTILEAVLRTLDQRPFVPGDSSWNWSTSLDGFRDKYFGGRWDTPCERAKGAFKRLRHRNAHPDWLTIRGGALAGPSFEQTLDDIVFLSTFYGYMIRALSGFKDLEPRFPKPMKDWRPLMTITSGASTP